MKKSFKRLILIYFSIIFSFFCCREKKEIENIVVKNLTKIGEFETNFTQHNEINFGRIDSFCFDPENNIYIADSGWNKIFKFRQDGNYIESFGREGQGPGEFMGNPRGVPLKISYGNDGNFYVYDLGNNRISVFSDNFEFIKSHAIPLNTRINDTPDVNSNGDIYLVARIEDKLIHRLDNNLDIKASILDSKEHFKFPFHKPQDANMFRFVGEFDLRKAITGEDHLIAVSNYSLTVFYFNDRNELITKFNIYNKLFKNDFLERIKSLKRDKERKEGTFLPFYLFLDQTEQICLGYANSSISNFEIYRYKKDGTLIDVVRFPERVITPIECDYHGNIYAIKRVGTEMTLGKYQLKE